MGGRSGGKRGIAKKAGRFVKTAKPPTTLGSKKSAGRENWLDGGSFSKRQGGESEGNRGY